MSAIIAQAVFMAQQGNEERLSNILKELITSSIKEAGCLHYEGYQDKKKPLLFVILEKWKDKESFIQHSKQPHLSNAFNEMESILEKPYSITFYNQI